MGKRWFVRILIFIAFCGVLVLVFPAIVYVPLGYLRHEPFYDSKPASYWARALKQEGFLGHAAHSGDVGKTLREGGAAAVPVLRELAAQPDENVRAEALRVLSFLGPDAKDAVPILAVAVKDETISGRFMLASEALARADPSVAAETFSAVLQDKTNQGRRSWALTELLKLAPQGREAVPVLTELVNNPNEDVLLRVQAIRTLRRLNQPAQPLVEALIAVVTADKSPAGVQALEALSEIGPAAKPALPTLLQMLQDPSVPLGGHQWGPPHRAAVIRALGGIGPEASSAIPILLPFLQSNNYFVRVEVALALANMGPAAKEVVMVRTATSWTSVALLSAPPAGNYAALPLVQVVIRTWIPWEERNLEAVREAILRVDPDVAPRPGGGN